MSTAVEDVVAKTEMLKEEKLNGTETITANDANEEEKKNHENRSKATEEEPRKEEVPLQLEPKSGVSFPVKLDDGKQLNAVGLRKKSMFGMGIKVYGFGITVYAHLTMSMVRKSFDEGLGAAIKKLTGGKNDELTKRILGAASDDIKLPKDSVIEITRLPGYVLQTTVMGEVVNKAESELLCRAYTYLYLGDDPFDKEAKENFGTSLLSLF